MLLYGGFRVPHKFQGKVIKANIFKNKTTLPSLYCRYLVWVRAHIHELMGHLSYIYLYILSSHIWNWCAHISFILTSQPWLFVSPSHFSHSLVWIVFVLSSSTLLAINKIMLGKQTYSFVLWCVDNPCLHSKNYCATMNHRNTKRSHFIF